VNTHIGSILLLIGFFTRISYVWSIETSIAVDFSGLKNERT
jgi:hypothetical protein